MYVLFPDLDFYILLRHMLETSKRDASGSRFKPIIHFKSKPGDINSWDLIRIQGNFVSSWLISSLLQVLFRWNYLRRAAQKYSIHHTSGSSSYLQCTGRVNHTMTFENWFIRSSIKNWIAYAQKTTVLIL